MNNDPNRFVRAIIESELISGRASAKAKPTPPPVVTVSRGYGSGGKEIARLLAERLGVDCYHKKILDAVTDAANVDRTLLERLDEQVAGLKGAWMYAILPGVDDPRQVYRRNLINILLGISVAGGVVVGRGANFVLGHHNAFRVRIVGSPQNCAQRLVKRLHCELTEALDKVRTVDQERARYIRNLYGRDINQATAYDLTINSDRFEPAQMVDLITMAILQAKPRPSTAEHAQPSPSASAARSTD